ncbi:MAG: hypothetical protein JSW58_08300 [Candidatus Latescibacterota bacterium]|nr:MAG: hypothetical protein JSW58_08300 [Candidatus Latescibacterota bacterium]
MLSLEELREELPCYAPETVLRELIEILAPEGGDQARSIAIQDLRAALKRVERRLFCEEWRGGEDA